MADKVHCPHCGTPFLYLNSNAESRVQCVRCGEPFGLVELPTEEAIPEAELAPEEPELPKAIPVARPKAREEHRRRRRRHPGPCPYGVPSKAVGPGTFLLVMGILQALVNLFFLVLLVIWVLNGVSTDEFVTVCTLATFVFLGLFQNSLTIRGAIAIRNTQSRRWGFVGAIAGCVPGLGCCWGLWLITLIPSIWCLVILIDPEVKQAFDWKFYTTCTDDKRTG